MAEHASQAAIGWGTQIQYGAESTDETYGEEAEVFANFHEVVSADPPDEQQDEIEVTHFESPNRTKEYVQGMTDAGSFTFKLNWRPDLYADHQQLVTDKADGIKRSYRIVEPSSMETIRVPGFVKGLKRTLDPKGVVQMEVTIRCDALTVTLPTIT